LGAVALVLLIVLAGGGGSRGEPTSPLPIPTPTSLFDPLDPATFFLEITSPEELESVIEVPTITVAGRTRADAVVSVNDTILAPDIDGRFSLIVDLEEGVNVIEVVSSVASGEQLDVIIAVIYAP
jgi:hypothetical protein